MISFEEAAIAFAKQLMRAEQAEVKVKELEAELKSVVRLPDDKSADKKPLHVVDKGKE